MTAVEVGRLRAMLAFYAFLRRGRYKEVRTVLRLRSDNEARNLVARGQRMCLKVWREKPDRTPPKCRVFGCADAPLVWMKVGESRQTRNGFLIAKVKGWYCPICATSYGAYCATTQEDMLWNIAEGGRR